MRITFRQLAVTGLIMLAALSFGVAPALGQAAGSTVNQPDGAQLVVPRPGMENVHPIPWDSYRVINPRTVRIFFWTGVEPCNVLDHVNVRYLDRQVRVTLFSGNDPAAGDDVACIEIAVLKAVDVHLSQPLRGRPVVDGSQTPARENVSGRAVAGPVCPVESFPPDPNCAPRPVAGAAMVVTSRGGRPVARDVTDRNGNFAFSLRVGRYTLVPQPVRGLLGTAPPVDFSVQAGVAQHHIVTYDTGIR